MIRDTVIKDSFTTTNMKRDAIMLGAAYDVVVYNNVTTTDDVGLAENENVVKYRLQYEEKRDGTLVQVTETPVRQHYGNASVLAAQLGPLDVLPVCLDHDASVSKSVSEINNTVFIEKKRHVVLPIMYTGDNIVLTVLNQEVHVVVIKDMVKTSKLFANHSQCSNPFAHNDLIIPVEQLTNRNICHMVFKVMPGQRVFFSNRVYFYTITIGEGGEEVREVVEPLYPNAAEVHLCTCGRYNNPNINYCRFCKVSVEPEEWARHEREHTWCFDCKRKVGNMYLHILQMHKSRANMAYLSVYERNSYRMIESEMKGKRRRMKAAIKRENVELDTPLESSDSDDSSGGDSDCAAKKSGLESEEEDGGPSKKKRRAAASKKVTIPDSDEDKEELTAGGKKKRKRKPETQREKGMRIGRQKRCRVKKKTLTNLQKQLTRLLEIFGKQIINGKQTTLITETVSTRDVGADAAMQPCKVVLKRMAPNPDEPATSNTRTAAEIEPSSNDEDSGVEEASFDTKDCSVVTLDLDDSCSIQSLSGIVASAAREEDRGDEDEKEAPPPEAPSPPASPRELVIDDKVEEATRPPSPVGSTSPPPPPPPKPPSPPPQPEVAADPPPPPAAAPPEMEEGELSELDMVEKELNRVPTPPPPPPAADVPKSKSKLSSSSRSRDSRKKSDKSKRRREKSAERKSGHEKERKKSGHEKERRKSTHDREKSSSRHDKKAVDKHSQSASSTSTTTTAAPPPSALTIKFKIPKKKHDTVAEESAAVAVTPTHPAPEEKKEPSGRPRACHPPRINETPYGAHSVDVERQASQMQHHHNNRRTVVSTPSPDRTAVLNVKVSPGHSTSVTFPNATATSVFNRVNPPPPPPPATPQAPLGVPVPSTSSLSASRLFSSDIIPPEIRLSTGSSSSGGNRRYDEPRLSDNYHPNGNLPYAPYNPENPSICGRPLASTMGTPHFVEYPDDGGPKNNYESIFADGNNPQYLGLFAAATQDYNNYQQQQQQYPQVYSGSEETLRAVQSITH